MRTRGSVTPGKAGFRERPSRLCERGAGLLGDGLVVELLALLVVRQRCETLNAREIAVQIGQKFVEAVGISRVPITIMFARRVGELMCELSDNATPKASFRFYI